MFSVVIPSYNHVEFLPEAIVSAMTEKTVAEILIADDGSSDGSVSVIEQLCEIHAPRLSNLTSFPARNVGAHATINDLIAAAKYDWVAILNSDDRFAPGRFSAVQNRLRTRPFDFCFGNLAIIDANSEVVGRKRAFKDPQYPFAGAEPLVGSDPENLFGGLLCQNYIATTSNMVFTKKLWDAVGGFRPYRYVHDWDFALRAMLVGTAFYIDEYMALYRQHGANTIRAARDEQNAEVQKLFDRLKDDFGEQVFRGHEGALTANAYLST